MPHQRELPKTEALHPVPAVRAVSRAGIRVPEGPKLQKQQRRLPPSPHSYRLQPVRHVDLALLRRRMCAFFLRTLVLLLGGRLPPRLLVGIALSSIEAATRGAAKAAVPALPARLAVSATVRLTPLTNLRTDRGIPFIFLPSSSVLRPGRSSFLSYTTNPPSLPSYGLTAHAARSVPPILFAIFIASALSFHQ